MNKQMRIKFLGIVISLGFSCLILIFEFLSGQAAKALEFTSGSGFIVAPTSIQVDVTQETTATVYLTISRESDGAPGICDGNFVITQTPPVLQKLFEYNYFRSDEDSIGSIALDMASSGEGLTYFLGEDVRLYNGDIGIIHFNTANEVDFDEVVGNITNGVNDQVGFGYTLYSTGGFWHGTGGVGGFESYIFNMYPDFSSYTISEIQMNVNTLSITSENYSADVDWSIWGYPPMWVYPDQESGNLEIGASQQIILTFDARGLVQGEYHTNLEINPGSICGEVLSIPITMTVTEPCHPIMGTNVSQVTPDPIYPNEEISFSAAIFPNNATPPFWYSIDGETEIITDALPIPFEKSFDSSGTHIVDFSVRNCDLQPAQAITDVITVTVSEYCYPITEVVLNQATKNPIYPGDTVEIEATLLPMGVTHPYTYSIDGGSEITTNIQPIAFEKIFALPGTHPVYFTARNCEQTPSQAVRTSIDILVDVVKIFLPVILK